MLVSEEPMVWKAALLGAKMVRSGFVSREVSRLALTTAPPKPVRLKVCTVLRRGSGGMKKESMMWTMPFWKGMSC